MGMKLHFSQTVYTGLLTKKMEVLTMKWEKPTYQDYRFGFEVTMYIMNR